MFEALAQCCTPISNEDLPLPLRGASVFWVWSGGSACGARGSRVVCEVLVGFLDVADGLLAFQEGTRGGHRGVPGRAFKNMRFLEMPAVNDTDL